jgi:RimJ/RimL family protein N-acetyltransferase
MKRLKSIAAEVYAILSDEQTLTFLPEKRLDSREHAESFLRGSLLSYHSGKNYLHFISQKSSGKVIGIFDLIPPETARQHYVLADYPYFLEFYLGSAHQQQGVMSALLPHFIDSLKKKKIKNLAAIAHRHNGNAHNTLIKAGFVPSAAFDPFQDLYTYTG